MIATVRIAPVEHWCEYPKTYMKENPLMAKLPGQSIAINTANVIPSPYCGGRWWEVEASSDDRLCKLLGDDGGPRVDTPRVCEHLLEMD